jgi:Restriction endonuclease NotI
MALLQIGEVFGHGANESNPAAVQDRIAKSCPFRNGSCNKSSLTDPIGICSFTDGNVATVVCPNRFLESNRMFIDAGRLAFGGSNQITVHPELRILRIQEPSGRIKKIGKVDFLLALHDAFGKVIDFSALEVQAVYFSGKSIRPALDEFLRSGVLDKNGLRRPDFRSSAQKRLMPQLSIKVPVFRRWGKRFFVAVDESFFSNMPLFRQVDEVENSELAWLVYPFSSNRGGFLMGNPKVIFSTWDDVDEALREGKAPSKTEILQELNQSSQSCLRIDI